MAHVSENKKTVVKEIVDLLDTYPVIGVVNMSNLPAKQVQSMRAKLRGKKTVLRMTKKRLMKIAFSQSKHGEQLQPLIKHMDGMPALIFTTENPFKLYGELQKTKSKAPAKAGQKAPKEITVQAGPTPFAPGPVIGQLGKFGIKTGVEGGKIVIKQDSIVAKKGDVINAELAGILTRLAIEPMEIGLDLTAVYENGTVFTSDLLYVDEKAYAQKICTAYNEALNMAVYVAYPSPDTMNILIGKAFTDAKALAISQGILTPETMPSVLAVAYAQMLSLSGRLPAEALSDELKSGNATVQESAAPAPQEEKKEKKEEVEAAGLGSLFG